MVLGRLSWTGIAAAACGWLVLLGGDWGLAQVRLWADPIHVVGVGQGLILTGIGCAIVDALHQGFGALNRFFDAVLNRSAARSQAAVPVQAAPPPPAPPPPRPAPAAPPPPRPAPPRYNPPVQAPEPEPDIVERGRMGARAYLLYADGSVEVETLLGVRRFATLDEAREFIGS